MLVICNGAIKSGSTWLYNILLCLVDLKHPPKEYLTENSKKNKSNPCIIPDRLPEFIANEDIVNIDYLSKNHIGSPVYRDVLVNQKNIFVFDIDRDIKDVIVSSYYDHCNRNNYKGAFGEYYWSLGRKEALYILNYQNVWRDNYSNVYIAS